MFFLFYETAGYLKVNGTGRVRFDIMGTQSGNRGTMDWLKKACESRAGILVVRQSLFP